MRVEIVEMQASLSRLQSKKKGGLIEILGFVFKSLEDTSAWAEANLPNHFPFGCFVDIYSFMEQISPQFSGGIKYFELQYKLCVSGERPQH